MAARLVIGASAYALHEQRDGVWAEIAVLPGGAAALLPSTVDALQLEAAIERAEDWLMPHAARLRGEMLEVHDEIGRVAAGLNEVLGVAAPAWSVADVEMYFERIVSQATGRLPSPEIQARAPFAADLLLLRELAHHGRLAGLRFRTD